MIERFESGKWYRWIGGKEKTKTFNDAGKMDFVLDKKPHQCNKGNADTASFFDCAYTDAMWIWDLSAFVECNPETQFPEPLPYTAPDGRRYNVYTHLHPQLKGMLGTYGYFYDYSATRIGDIDCVGRLKGIKEYGHPVNEKGNGWTFFAVPAEQDKTAKIVITENGETREVELTQKQIEQLVI